MAKTMRHWNGHQVCVIDTETTGLDPNYNEIIQICVMPLDSDFEVRDDVMPFYINMKPDHPERASEDAMRVNGLDLAELCTTGMDQEKAKDLFDEWVNTLDLPYTKYGQRKKIIPLGQNYAFDQAFIKRWLGCDLYETYFHYHFKDTMIVAAFLNDQASMHAEKVPYHKLGLSYLCNKLSIPHARAHDALQDCQATARVYKILTEQGLLF